ncbi:MAG: hypothetical protein ACKVRP_04140 [Bacteroidota bacterium]
MKTMEQTPEQLELGQKETLLRQRQEVLAELELSFSTLQGRLKSFEIEYYFKVGSKYVQLDQLQATLDKILASRIPFDSTAQRKASESEQKANQSARDAEEFILEHKDKQKEFHSNPELKSLYRELAKLLHPDLTLDAEEKDRRHHLMQEINEAYQAGRIERLREILEAEKNNPNLIKGDDVGSSLARVIRKIAQVDKRIADIEKELEKLHQTELHILMEAVERQMKNGTNLLDKMADELDSSIVFLEGQIKQVNL